MLKYWEKEAAFKSNGEYFIRTRKENKKKIKIAYLEENSESSKTE